MKGKGDTFLFIKIDIHLTFASWLLLNILLHCLFIYIYVRYFRGLSDAWN